MGLDMTFYISNEDNIDYFNYEELKDKTFEIYYQRKNYLLMVILEENNIYSFGEIYEIDKTTLKKILTDIHNKIVEHNKETKSTIDEKIDYLFLKESENALKIIYELLDWNKRKLFYMGLD